MNFTWYQVVGDDRPDLIRFTAARISMKIIKPSTEYLGIVPTGSTNGWR